MKSATSSDGCGRTVFVLLAAALAWGAPVASFAQLPPAPTVYSWGTDTDSIVAGSAAHLPRQDFYIGHLGSGLTEDSAIHDKNYRNFALSGAPPETTYGYWTLYGPNPRGGTGGLSNLNWGRAQADALMQAVATGPHRAQIAGRVLFGDIEGPLNGHGLGTWTSSPAANMDVVNGFIVRLLEGGYQPGIYIGPGFWDAAFGPSTTLATPVVLWKARWINGDRTYDPRKAVFQSAAVEDRSPAFLTESLWGMYPSIWQFAGDAGNLTIQPPSQISPLPVDAVRGLYPHGLHVDYYNDTAPSQIVLDQPINWATFTNYVTSAEVAQMAFTWNTLAPAPGVHNSFWSARFEGTVLVPEEGDYAFYLEQLDDGGRLILDVNRDALQTLEQVILDEWKVQGPHAYAAIVHLEPGGYPLRVEYAQGPPNQASLYVSWSCAGCSSRGPVTKELLGPAYPGATVP